MKIDDCTSVRIVVFVAASVKPPVSSFRHDPPVVSEDRGDVQVLQEFVVVTHTTPFARRNSMNVASGMVTYESPILALRFLCTTAGHDSTLRFNS